MITEREAQRLPFKSGSITTSDLSPGPDEGTTVSADFPAEVANVQIGGDNAGNLSDVLAVVVGVPAERFKETTKSKATVDLQNSTPADVPEDTLFWFGKRGRQSRGGPEITSRLLEEDYSDVPKVNREDLTPKAPGVREDQLLTLNAYNPSTSFTVSLSDSSLRVPVQLGTDQ